MKKKTFTTICLYPYIGYKKVTVNGYQYRDDKKHLNVYKYKNGIWYATTCGCSIGEGKTRTEALEDGLLNYDKITAGRIKKAHEIYRKAARIK